MTDIIDLIYGVIEAVESWPDAMSWSADPPPADDRCCDAYPSCHEPGTAFLGLETLLARAARDMEPPSIGFALTTAFDPEDRAEVLRTPPAELGRRGPRMEVDPSSVTFDVAGALGGWLASPASGTDAAAWIREHGHTVEPWQETILDAAFAERIPGLRDASMTLSGFWEAPADPLDDVRPGDTVMVNGERYRVLDIAPDGTWTVGLESLLSVRPEST